MFVTVLNLSQQNALYLDVFGETLVALEERNLNGEKQKGSIIVIYVSNFELC